jgi:hypothetical protein
LNEINKRNEKKFTFNLREHFYKKKIIERTLETFLNGINKRDEKETYLGGVPTKKLLKER